MSSSRKVKPKYQIREQLLANYYLSKYNKSTPKFNNNIINTKYNQLLQKQHRKNIVKNIKNKKYQESHKKYYNKIYKQNNQYHIKQQVVTTNASSNSKKNNSPTKYIKNTNKYSNHQIRKFQEKFNQKFSSNTPKNIQNLLTLQNPSKKNSQKQQKITNQQTNNLDIKKKITNYQHYIQKLKNVQIQIQNQKIQLNLLNQFITSIYHNRNPQPKQNTYYQKSISNTSKHDDSFSYQQPQHNSSLNQNILQNCYNNRSQFQQHLKQHKQSNRSSLHLDSHHNKTTIDVTIQQQQKIQQKIIINNRKYLKNNISQSKSNPHNNNKIPIKLSISHSKNEQPQKQNNHISKINIIKKIHPTNNLTSRPQKSQYQQQNNLLSYRKCYFKSNHHYDRLSHQYLINQQQKSNIMNQLNQYIRSNSFGIYQTALVKLKQLMEQYPNSQPMFVIAQKILQDRLQYENRYQLQQNKRSQLKDGIRSIRQVHLNESEFEKNNHKMLKLVRELTKLLANNNQNTRFNKIL